MKKYLSAEEIKRRRLLADQADRILSKDAYQRLGKRAGNRAHYRIKAGRYQVTGNTKVPDSNRPFDPKRPDLADATLQTSIRRRERKKERGIKRAVARGAGVRP